MDPVTLIVSALVAGVARQLRTLCPM
jgi:hypothetical protein